MLIHRISKGRWASWLLVVCLLSSRLVQGGGEKPTQRMLECGKYHASRIAFLLGCCGDVGMWPPGPPFPGSLSDGQRAKLALDEIDTAQKRGCVVRGSREHLSLLLESAGAHIMLAQALSVDAATQTSRSRLARLAATQADSAVIILKGFTKQHPAESSEVWPWIAEAFRQAGGPWEDFAFLFGMDSKCCEPAQVARIEGDLLFDLGVTHAASLAYSNWLAGKGPSDFCGEEKSFQNATELRRRGFAIPELLMQPQGVCMSSQLAWRPYIELPPKGKFSGSSAPAGAER